MSSGFNVKEEQTPRRMRTTEMLMRLRAILEEAVEKVQECQTSEVYTEKAVRTAQ